MIAALSTQAQKMFTGMTCQNLSGKEVKLPQSVKGKHTLLCLAYSKKAEADLNTWYEPVYLQFIHEPKNPGMFYESFDINTYFIPMFSGVNKAAIGQFKKQVETKVDSKLHEHLLYFKGNANDIKKNLDMTQKDEPYLFLLDENGKIVYETSGAYSEKKMIEIEELIEGE